jgi:hypothetical protein
VSVRFDATGEHYTSTSGVLTAASGTCTVTCWGRIAVDRNEFSTFVAFDANGATGDYIPLQTGNNGTTLGLYTSSGDGTDITAGQAMTVGTWYPMAFTINAGAATLYSGLTPQTLNTASQTGWTASGLTAFHIGGYPRFTAEFLNGNVANVKHWSAVLTAAEIVNELQQYAPVRTADLVRWHPLINTTYATIDYSGNGRTLTGGTGTATEDGPPILWETIEIGLIIPSSAVATTASAENASGTGTANQPAASVKPAGLDDTEGTGTANQPAVQVTVNAGLATGTGTANDTAFKYASAGDATGTGTAHQSSVSVTATAGAASGAGSAETPGTARTAGVAVGTGEAFQPSVSVVATAGHAVGTGTAFDTAFKYASAGNAAATGTANDATVSVAAQTTATAEAAEATGTGNNAAPVITVNAGHAAGTGTANDATISTIDSAQAEAAAGTGAANQPSISVKATAGAADATGTAEDGAPTAEVRTNVSAGNASATGEAFQPASHVRPNAETTTGTGTATDAAPSVKVTAETGTGTGTGEQPSPSVTVGAETTTTTTGTANQAAAAVQPPAGAGTGTGTGNDAATSVTVSAGLAGASGTALNPATNVSEIPEVDALPGVAGGDGAALDATILVQSRPTGGWHSLLNILRQARADTGADRGDRACPHCGEPYRRGPSNEPFCPFDGYSPQGRGPSTGRRDWGGLVAALTDGTPRQDMVATLDDQRAGWGP